MAEADTLQYVRVKTDGNEKFLLETVMHKYSKALAWMFYGTIVSGKKGPAVLWEKSWGKMKSSTYDTYILAGIQTFLNDYLDYSKTWLYRTRLYPEPLYIGNNAQNKILI